MRLDDDFDLDDDLDYSSYSSMKQGNKSVLRTAFIFMSVLILVILVVVLQVNKEQLKKRASSSKAQVGQTAGADGMQDAQTERDMSVQELISGSKMTADDLDIWTYTPMPVPSVEELEKEPAEKTQEEKMDLPPSEDGLHTLIVHENGKEEWVDMNPYLARNTYNYSGLVCQNSIMKYYENNNKISHLGVDISKEQEYVDFSALKKAGVEFVMIRLGQRGYQSGEITLDDHFDDNMQRAAGAKLDVGVYFFSQAVTLDEAEEEADFVIEHLKDYEVKYPVVFMMGSVPREKTRAESIEKMIRTNIAIKFMEKVKEAGYYTMLCGNKEWLIQKFSLGSVMDYDIWLKQDMDIPDYPYEFIMWQYTTEGKIDGISGSANLNICFVDFSLR